MELASALAHRRASCEPDHPETAELQCAMAALLLAREAATAPDELAAAIDSLADARRIFLLRIPDVPRRAALADALASVIARRVGDDAQAARLGALAAPLREAPSLPWWAADLR